MNSALRPIADGQNEVDLATRAAWLHFAGGLTQVEVARRLGVPSLKAHRLIARATRDGLVRVYVDGRITECVQLELELAGRYELRSCEVVPDIDGTALPIRSLGLAGARFLQQALERRDYALIGIGHGRTLAAAVESLPRVPSNGTRFVSLLGGLTRKFSANPHDVIHRVAERTGAEAFVMPVPFFANTLEDRAVLMAQRGIQEVFDLARQANLLFVGIGTVEPEASLVATGMVEREELAEVRRAGGCGEVLGHFFDAKGEVIETSLSQRTLALGLEDLRDRNMVGIAGGTAKVAAIRSVLESRLLGGLITDETTAKSLVSSSKGGLAR